MRGPLYKQCYILELKFLLQDNIWLTHRVICPHSVSTRYDVGKDKFIDFEELKHMMEKLGAPQTHLALKEMIRQVDEDQDSKISFREVRRSAKSIKTSKVAVKLKM